MLSFVLCFAVSLSLSRFVLGSPVALLCLAVGRVSLSMIVQSLATMTAAWTIVVNLFISVWILKEKRGLNDVLACIAIAIGLGISVFARWPTNEPLVPDEVAEKGMQELSCCSIDFFKNF